LSWYAPLIIRLGLLKLYHFVVEYSSFHVEGGNE